MEDFIGFSLVLLLVAVIVMLAMAGLAVLVFAVVVAGVGLCLFHLVRGLVAIIAKIQKERKRAQRHALEQQQSAARLALAEAQNAERERLDLERTKKRLEAEETRRQSEQVQRAREQAAREELESEYTDAGQCFSEWNAARFDRRPTAQEIAAAIADGRTAQSRCGKYLHVIVFVNAKGMALQWKAHTGSSSVPQVVGLRDSIEMFTEWAFAGKHAAAMAPGRHTLAFRISPHGEADQGDIDLSFEIFVPKEEPAKSIDPYKQAVQETTKAFINRNKTLARAKRRVRQTLETNSADPDEIEVELAKFESDVDHNTNQEDS